MATIAELNIRLGLLTREFDRNLRDAERKLQASGNRLSSIGDRLTTAISIPLAGIGIAAIKSAGDIEALRLAMVSTFESAGRSVSEANAELEELRKAALAPGLDFEQAIKASVRLQNVGFEAEAARATIVELANAVALTGGTADDLSEVTNQFAQMVGKGKLFQDDIKIILGRMPKLAAIMKETFGTTTAEGINALGIDARTFIETVTREMQKIPRVSGGIKNAIVNVFTGLQLEAARLGEEINRVFNVSDATESFLAAIRKVVDGFVALDDSTKRFIVRAALVVAAIGPIVKIMGVLRLAQAAAVAQYANIVRGFDKVVIVVQRAAAAYRALSIAQKAAFLGGIALAVTLAVEALVDYNRELSAAEKAQASVANIAQQASEDISQQRVQVNELVGVLKDENATREEQRRALEALQRIAPDQFKNLDIETLKTKDLDTAVNAYIDSLLRAAKAKRAFARLEEIDKLRESLIKTAEPGIWQTLKNAVVSAGNGIAFTALQADTQAANFVKLRAELDKEEEALRGVIKANGDFISTVSGASKPTETYTANIEKAAAATNKLKDAQQRSAPIAGFDSVSTLSVPLGIDFEPVKRGTEELKKLQEAAIDLIQKKRKESHDELMQQLEQEREGRQAVVDQAFSSFQSILGNINSIQQSNSEKAVTALEAEYAAKIEAAKGNATLQANLEKQLAAKREQLEKQSAKKSKAIAYASAIVNIAQGVTKALAAAVPPFNFALAALVSAAGAVQLGTIAATPLAEGGVITGPTLALVGEYPGAATNPEIVTPENKLRRIFKENGGGGGILTTILKGDDIQIVLDRAAKRRGRTR